MNNLIRYAIWLTLSAFMLGSMYSGVYHASVWWHSRETFPFVISAGSLYASYDLFKVVRFPPWQYPYP